MGSSGNGKLQHLVRRYVSSCPDPKNPNVNSIVSRILSKHTEYQRKDFNRFKEKVEKAVQEVLVAPPSSPESNSRISSRKRRKRNKESRDKVLLSDSENGTSNDESSNENKKSRTDPSINGMLSKGYRQLQEERAATATDEAQNQAGAETQAQNESQAPNVGVGAEKSMDVETKTNPQNSDGVSKVAKSGSKEKRKKRRSISKLSKRQSISKNSMFPPDDGTSQDFLKPVPRPWERYSDLGGINRILQQIKETVEYPLFRPELYKHLGVDPPRGVLLRGPPGCGKTHLANAVAGQLGIPYFRVTAPELVSGMSGESEGRIRDLFREAAENAPSIIFMDELDAIATKRGDSANARGMDKRIVAQLLTCMDMLSPKYTNKSAPVVVFAATNQAESLDPALRRAGRFDKEILLGVPDEAEREDILRRLTARMMLCGDLDYKALARKIPGFVGADIMSLTKEAALAAIKRFFEEDQKGEGTEGETEGGGETRKLDATPESVPLKPTELTTLFITLDDFLSAIPLVQPSCMREGFAMVPDVSWDDVGALHQVRADLSLSVLEPIRHPEKFRALGIPLPSGILLYGPPGCGKTLLAKAVSNESGCNFISVKGPELLDKYVGESERAVRSVFERARNSSPCIVFFDELDSLCPKRGSGGGGGGGVSERVVNQLLTEMDGLESRRSIFIIAATNRPELIDPAMLRPGRLDKLLYVPLPTPDDRVAILQAACNRIKLGEDVDLDKIGRSPRATGYSGADCKALLREAGLEALKEFVSDSSNICIASIHFERAFCNVMPSVSKKDQLHYDRMRQRIAKARTRGGVIDSENNNNETDP